jgi:DedD protein
MKSLFDEDDQEAPRSDADLTLGIGSLLSIFFGVVLICGIFFGFGYSMGRRNAHPTVVPATPPQTATNALPLPENELSGAPLKPQQPDSGAAFPSDDTNPAPNTNPDTSPDRTLDKSKSQSSAQPAAPSPAKHAPKNNSVAQNSAPSPAASPATSKTTHVVEPAAPPTTSLNAVPVTHPAKPHAGVMAPLAQAPGDDTIIPGHPIMVQIAAVSRQEDAEVLAGALRKRGFNPTIRPGSGDKFFHVQVGPFTDKSQAETIKQHLLADGYNAIMK